MKADTNMVLCVLVCVLIVLVLYRIIVKACQRKEQFYQFDQPMGLPPSGFSMEGNVSSVPDEFPSVRYNNKKIDNSIKPVGNYRIDNSIKPVGNYK